jgi:HK97 family phage major capsid protein
MDPIQQQLKELGEKQQSFLQKAQTDIAENGRVAVETKTALEELRTQIKGLQTQTDAIDVQLKERHTASTPEAGLEEELKANEGLTRLMTQGKGSTVLKLRGKALRDVMERKTTITSGTVGAQTTGVLTIEREPGIVAEARQRLKIRNLLSARPTNMQVIDYVKVNAAMAIGSPQTEASDKGENANTFTAVSATVRTLATWIPASRQVLEDLQELQSFLMSTLGFYVDLDEEIELLSGDNTGVHLNGLITQATAFNTALTSNSAGWNKIDLVGRAAQQVEMAKELQPSFVCVNPKDYWDMRLQKDSYGRYILGDPQGPVNTAALFDLQPVRTTSIAQGKFLVGSGDPAAVEIRDRMEMQVEISTEHSDYFTKNLIAIRAEKRLALIVKRPASFITGTFTTSP